VARANDLPTLNVGNFAVSEGGTFTLTSAHLSAADEAGETATGSLVFVLTALPSRGALQKSGTALGLNGTFTVNDISGGLIRFVDPGSEVSPSPTTVNFSVKVQDGNAPVGESAPKAVSVTLTRVNDNPVLATNAGATVNEGGSVTIGTSALRTTDEESAAGSVTYTVTTLPGRGTLRVNGADLGLNGTFTQAQVDANQLVYFDGGADPAANTSFAFTVRDGDSAQIGPSTFNLTVNGVNDLPVANPTGPFSTAEDTAGIFDVFSGTDPEGFAAGAGAVQITAAPGVGTLVVNAARTVTFTPPGNYNGSTSFKYRLVDASGATSNEITASITVTPVADPPIANPDSYSTNEDTPLTNFNPVANNDTDGDGTVPNVTGNTNPSVGTLTRSGNLFTYTPPLNYSGSTSFQYTISDGTTSASTTVTLTVNPVDDPLLPVTNNNQAVAEGGSIALNGALLYTDADLDASSVVYTVNGNMSYGCVARNGNCIGSGGTFTQAEISAGTIGYKNNGANGPYNDSFSFTVNGAAGSHLYNVSFVDDPPYQTAYATSYVHENEQGIIGAPQTYWADEEGANVRYHIDSLPTQIAWLYDPGTGGYIYPGGSFVQGSVNVGIIAQHTGVNGTYDANIGYHVSDGTNVVYNQNMPVHGDFRNDGPSCYADLTQPVFHEAWNWDAQSLGCTDEEGDGILAIENPSGPFGNYGSWGPTLSASADYSSQGQTADVTYTVVDTGGAAGTGTANIYYNWIPYTTWYPYFSSYYSVHVDYSSLGINDDDHPGGPFNFQTIEFYSYNGNAYYNDYGYAVEIYSYDYYNGASGYITVRVSDPVGGYTDINAEWCVIGQYGYSCIF
jgi:hypothetical protein